MIIYFLQTLQDFDESFERALHLDWEKSKKKIFEEIGQHQGQDVSRSTGYTSGFALGASSGGGMKDSGVFFIFLNWRVFCLIGKEMKSLVQGHGNV